ncbi:phage tail tube protein [Schlesneria paludicola]|uniref:phage tail tube protein n=1 Tax=Schlesneria paludicola TaxID=360056 RepID=UPI00029B266D|nr:phage tail tube protein [Schlesneria paludicola]
MTEPNILIGAQRFLRLAVESSWATLPGSPVWVDTPCDDYTVRFKPKNLAGQPRAGLMQRKYSRNVSGHPAGNLVTSLYGWKPTGLLTSLAQAMLEWGFTDHESKAPRSKSAQWVYTSHDDDKQHAGLRVNQATLAGSEAGIKLTLELIGKTETILSGQTSTPPNDRHQLVDFLWEDCSFKLDGTVMPFSSFQWSVQRSVAPVYQNSKVPTSCPKAGWVESFSITPLKSDNSFDVLRNDLEMTELPGELVLKGLHNGTGGPGTDFTVCTVAFPRLSFVDSDESGGVGVIENPLTWNVLKPDTASPSSTMTWTEA